MGLTEGSSASTEMHKFKTSAFEVPFDILVYYFLTTFGKNCI
jgi:hypothetical protein